jgi:hypothetical protein
MKKAVIDQFLLSPKPPSPKSKGNASPTQKAAFATAACHPNSTIVMNINALIKKHVSRKDSMLRPSQQREKLRRFAVELLEGVKENAINFGPNGIGGRPYASDAIDKALEELRK